jgi:hypothetical protein
MGWGPLAVGQAEKTPGLGARTRVNTPVSLNLTHALTQFWSLNWFGGDYEPVRWFELTCVSALEIWICHRNKRNPHLRMKNILLLMGQLRSKLQVRISS